MFEVNLIACSYLFMSICREESFFYYLTLKFLNIAIDLHSFFLVTFSLFFLEWPPAAGRGRRTGFRICMYCPSRVADNVRDEVRDYGLSGSDLNEVTYMLNKLDSVNYCDSINSSHLCPAGTCHHLYLYCYISFSFAF